jgi:hypothetical protein
MNIFKKIFGNQDVADNQENNVEKSQYAPDINTPVDELFTINFKNNGGKFIYCSNMEEAHENFENILEENDWFEKEALCYDADLTELLVENKLDFDKPSHPAFLLASCENLIAEEGSILFSSKQIKQLKPDELPDSIIVVATTSQILRSKSDGLSAIKKKYVRDYPTNITTIKYFEKAKEEDFTQYGSSAKNLYLLLLEDL